MMTQEQREALVVKWVVRIGRVSLFTLILYFAYVFALAYKDDNGYTAASALGGLIGHVLITVSFISVPEQAVTKIVERYHRIQPRFRGEHVYIIKDIDISGYCKIGRTNDLHTRLATFEVKLPFEIEVIAIIPCENSTRLERQLHTQYASKRIRGEWFCLSTDDLEAIRGLTR